MKIVVLPGDGSGPETMAATLEVLQAASARFDLDLQFDHDVAGHESLTRHGATVTPALLAKVKAADGLMLGPMATYDFKDEARGEINPSKFFRKELDLYANIRPARTWSARSATPSCGPGAGPRPGRASWTGSRPPAGPAGSPTSTGARSATPTRPRPPSSTPRNRCTPAGSDGAGDPP